MILADQLFTAIARHVTELVIDVGDPSFQIRLGKNGGGIHGPSVFIIHESGSLSLAEGGANTFHPETRRRWFPQNRRSIRRKTSCKSDEGAQC